MRFFTVMLTAVAVTGTVSHKDKPIASGSVLDYAVPHCLDDDGNRRCTAPFTVSADACYYFKWSTEGTLSHTTVEVRDAGSSEIVHYRDTDGEWTADKNELVYLDFKPKVWKTGNDTVDYEVWKCKDKKHAQEMK